jgi:beta-galactosidase
MDTNKHEWGFELRRQSAAAPALSGGRAAIELPVAFGRAKAVSRFACHRSPRRAGLLLGLALLFLVAGDVHAQRERVAFNDGWGFVKIDPARVQSDLNYTNLRPWLLPTGNAFRATNQFVRPEDKRWKLGDWAPVILAETEVDPSKGRKVTLPHDWGIEGPFRQELPGETGKLPWDGVAWYVKRFNLATNEHDKRFILEMDGAMSYATVWMNGALVGGWPYGYASWQVDLTPYVSHCSETMLAIRLDNPKDSSRWYPGGGIYRNVWLTKTTPVHVGQWGVQITTPEVSKVAAMVVVNVALENDSQTEARVSLRNEIFELKASGQRGAAICDISITNVILAAGAKQQLKPGVKFASPKLWSVAQPNRYVAVTTIEQNGKVLDRVETPFGLRTIQFTSDNGFLLNGERVPIRGVCNHHDLGALGAAFNTRAAERQLEILKEMGCNAIRTAHNPPAPELLELCDRMGFLVMVEAFDCWKGRKKPNDYHLLFWDWFEADLRAMVRHFRNHPSVIIWSTGNEMPDQRNAQGVELSKRLTAIVHEEDPTRPVTAGCNHDVAGFNGFQNTVDIFGYNYKPHLYAKFRATNSLIPLYGSETASTVSTRGEYFFPVSDDKSQGLADFQVSSYDLSAPRWAMRPEAEFAGQDTNTFVAGEFVWTGFDYLGEPTPYNSDLSNLNNYSNPEDRARAEQELAEIGKIRTPSRSSYFGIVDLAGFKKDRFYLYQARWRPEWPLAHILPHWNWPEREGEVTPVHVYTSGDEAELFLNGKSLGRKKKAALEYRLRWDDVKFAPGELKVVAYKSGKKWATDVTRTTGAAAKLTLQADRATIAADGKDLAFVTVTVADRKGQLVPRSKNQIKFNLTGPGEIVATDNGDPTSFESFQIPERKAFNGLALVIVRAKPGESGKIKLTATADGLASGSVAIRAK